MGPSPHHERRNRVVGASISTVLRCCYMLPGQTTNLHLLRKTGSTVATRGDPGCSRAGWRGYPYEQPLDRLGNFGCFFCELFELTPAAVALHVNREKSSAGQDGG